MEREILIAVTSTQKRYKVVTDAKTLGELKDVLDSNENILVKQGGEWVANTEPINYTGMSFTEGYSNTELLSDESQLPTSVEYRGNTTNNLIMVLTNTKKNISSGAGTRKEAYEKVKELGIQSAIKEHFGRNFTQVSTANLWTAIASATSARVDAVKPEPQPEPTFEPEDVAEKEFEIKTDVKHEVEEAEEEDITVEDVVVNNFHTMMVVLLDTGVLSVEGAKTLVCELTAEINERETADGLEKKANVVPDEDDIEDIIARVSR